MAEPSTAVLVAGAWLLTYLIHSTVLLGSATLVTLLFERSVERFAELAWRVALFGPILTTSAQLLWCAVPFPDLPLAQPLSAQSRFAEPLAAVTGAPSDWLVRLLPLLLVIWFAIAVLRVGALIQGVRALRLVLADRVYFAMRSGVRVSISVHTKSPMVIGTREICLPARAVTELSAAELEAVLSHEVAHVIRRDPLWLLASALVERVLFMQPFNRVASSHLHVLAECSCDDYAISHIENPVALASALASVTGWIGGATTRFAVGMASRQSLAVKRVRRILDPDASRLDGGKRPMQAGIAVAALSAVIAFAPGLTARSFSLAPLSRYVIRARDDAGPFTLTLERGRVVGMTIAGAVVSPSHIRQVDDRLTVTSVDGADVLHLTVTRDGGIRWPARSPFP